MRGPDNPLDAAPIGTAAHTVLERLFALPAAQRTPGRAESLVDRLMLELASPDTPAGWPGIERGSIGRWRAEVAGRVAGIFELEDPRAVLVRRTEWPLDGVEVAGVPFTGFVDRADIAGDSVRVGCRIVDYKSGRYRGVAPFGDDHGDQLRVYAEAVRMVDGALPVAADLLYIGARRARPVLLSRREMTATLEGFARAWAELKRHVAAQAFPATPSALCGWCPLVNCCPAAARDGKGPRADGLASAAQLGIPVLGVPVLGTGTPGLDPEVEPVLIPAGDVIAGDDPVDTRDVNVDNVIGALPAMAAAGPAAAAHMEGQEPGTTGATDGGTAMTSLLREDKPWEQTAGPDGRLNPNSYSATAVFGIVEMAVELLHRGGVPLRPSVVTALARTLAHVVLTVQRDLSGSTSYQDGVNTRLRGALRTAVVTMPLPFGRDAEAWSGWVARAIRRTDSIAKAAVGLFDDTDPDEEPWQALADLDIPTAGDTGTAAGRLHAVS